MLSTIAATTKICEGGRQFTTDQEHVWSLCRAIMEDNGRQRKREGERGSEKLWHKCL